jgi:hypothetical protein
VQLAGRRIEAGEQAAVDVGVEKQLVHAERVVVRIAQRLDVGGSVVADHERQAHHGA